VRGGAIPILVWGTILLVLAIGNAKLFLYFGIGILVLSLGRVVVELRAERATGRRVREELERR
jgi:hypothetical protein